MPIKTSSGKWKWGNVERSSKKELVQTVYGIWKKNGSKGSFSDFLKGTHESTISESTKRYAYHCTDVDPEIIKKEGWKVGDGFTLDNQFEDLYEKYLPKVPVFVSRLDVPVWDSKSKYCIKIDITGLDLFPDFGYLPDFGAYYDYDEECFYWENEDDLDSNKKLKDFVLNNCNNLTLYADCFDGEDSFNVLGTACIDGSKLKDRIVEYVSMRTGKRVKSESYEPPYSLDTIKQKYGDEVYRKLRDDPVHRFRAETGIEVIHKEPTRDEFERIVKNWDLMTPEQKKQSDEFSMKQFGNNNKNRIDLLRKEYDFEVGDKVKVRHGIRCKQAGHFGKIVRIDQSNKYGWSSFIVKFDEPELGTMGFFSNDLEKIDSIKEEKWSKNKRYFYCDDCNKNMVKAPLDQYIMIDDDLWEYVCKHGGKKLVSDEDVLCRDCIEKRLGRQLTLKDLGDKINVPINDEIKKMLNKRKNKMTSEAHEIHSYPEKLQSMLERIVKDNEDYEFDHAYFNKEGKFIWMRNSKGYFHVFKPVKFVKTPGMTKPFGFKDLILKDNGMLEEVDRLRFTDGNEGLKFLKDKYHLELKTIK